MSIFKILIDSLLAAIATTVFNATEFFEHLLKSFWQGTFLPSFINNHLVVKEETLFKVKS